MKTIITACARDCYDTCSLIVTLDDAGQIISSNGDPEHPLTRGFTCPRGAKDGQRLTTNRVTQPFLRRGTEFVPIDWEAALNIVATRFAEIVEKHGAEKLLYLDYAGNSGLMTEAFSRRLWYALGATQTDHAVCSKAGHRGIGLHYGRRSGVFPHEFAEKRLFVFWGFNATVSSPHQFALARKIREQHGANIVVIDPRRSETAQQADLWLQPCPGTDVAFAYGVMSYLIRQQAIDKDFLRQWTLGFDALQAEAIQWTPERVERVTGVSQAQLEALGELYCVHRPSATLIGIGLQKCDFGADQARAVSLIPALLGQHRGFYYTNGGAFYVDDDMIAGKTLTGKASPVISQVGLAELLASGAFRGMMVQGMNPAVTLPNQRAFRAGLQRDDLFIVVHDTHWSDTAKLADVVLPAPTYLEKADVVCPWSHDRIRLSPQVVAPITDSRDEVWLMRELARRFSVQEDWVCADPWNVMETAFDGAFEDGDWHDLMAGKLLTLKKRPNAEYETPSGKIELTASQAARFGVSPLPTQQEISAAGGEFTLLNSANVRYTSSQFQEVYGAIPAIVQINPKDATRLGIQQGDAVTLMNERGALRIKADVTDDVPPGLLWSPRQYADLEGVPQNTLMTSEPQAFGSGPRFNSTRVRILKQ
ncbi:formate dehydrogenase [Candidatus Moduliflexus flocculans]|uniref:Formate dehydrogenase n=1 Tax=Candidatus Moduliflexus flocculans TaxID=1499966 RepID=A0A0S6VY26_9BACT|nr:formate dehydrogenase [Candidatus Moduliflexus flocculans]